MPPGSAMLSSTPRYLTPSKDVMGFDDDVPDIEPHTEENAAAFGIAAGKSLMQDWNCMAARTASTALGNSARTRRRCSSRCGRRAPQSPARHLPRARQLGVRSLFVLVHGPEIAGHVGGQYPQITTRSTRAGAHRWPQMQLRCAPDRKCKGRDARRGLMSAPKCGS